MANENSCGRTAGFRAVDAISDEKIDPIPIPAPVRPIAARPAPMYFAAANIVNCFLIYTLCTAHSLFFLKKKKKQAIKDQKPKFYFFLI
jgi:hypothetical protein